MKKILIFLVVLILAVQIASAANVCVVVDYGKDGGEKPDSKCIDISEGMDGYYFMEQMGWTLLWTPNTTYGHMLCKIREEGTDVSGQYCEYDGDFWNLVLNRNGKWLHMPVGLDAPGPCWNYDENSWTGHYCTESGDVLGFAFGAAGYEPTMFNANATKVYVDGKSQTNLNNNGGKLKDAVPGSTIEFRLKFENLYSASTDIYVNIISVDGTFIEVDNGADIDQGLSDFDLLAGKDETKSLKFIVPLNAESKDRLLKITINARDDAGIRYEKTLTYDVRIEKDPHKLSITNAEMNKVSYTCGENALLSLTVLNLGDNKENVNLKIFNTELGINLNEKVELLNDPSDPSGKYEQRLNVLIPEGVEKKTYTLTIDAEYGNNRETEKLEIVVDNCDSSGSQETVAGAEEPETNLQGEGVFSEETTTGEKTALSSTEVTNVKTDKNAYYAIIGIVILLIVIMAALVTMFFVLRK
ncbi:MAG: hypothetical protein KKC75_00265 [Nanoarchaeota archaeon]|nr:hypothetical protein [Nanoarchaeota archaeon]MBU1004450.1 hypothetical protein [Nanoarchaeota archaeon]MBU1945420.1 hypothetical protein [Nanoarchaeota archaeon]